MRVRPTLAVHAIAGVLGLPACDATGDDPVELLTDPPFVEPPGEGDAAAVSATDDPVPVETDAGIGGDTGGTVTRTSLCRRRRRAPTRSR